MQVKAIDPLIEFIVIGTRERDIFFFLTNLFRRNVLWGKKKRNIGSIRRQILSRENEASVDEKEVIENFEFSIRLKLI